MKKIFFFIFLLILFQSCDSLELSNYSETIYINNNGASMPAYIYGNVASKKLMVVLHGGPGGNGLEYRIGDYARQIEENVGVVYFDQRGQGMAFEKTNSQKITIDDLTNDVFALVKVLKTKFGNDTKIFLYGHSWGGMLGTAYLLNPTYQQEVTGWIESNGAHDLPLLNKESIKLFKQVANEQIGLGNSVTDWQSILDWVNTIDEENISEEISGEINTKAFEVENYLRNDGILNYSENYGEYARFLLFGKENPLTSAISGNRTNGLLNTEIEQTALTSQLSEIKIPSLFLYSKYDFVVPAALGQSAYQLVSTTNKKLVIFEKSGHSPMDSEPNLYANEIVRFMSQF